MKKYFSIISIIVALVFAFGFAKAMAEPGTNTDGLPLTEPQLGSIVPFVTETGLISLSVDGLGTNTASGTIQVDKPAGATVRSAFMAAASTGFSDRMLANGDITIDGAPVVWDIVPTTPSSIFSHNSFADVTVLVKPKIDAAAAGLVDFTIGEVSSGSIDGSVLAVIFDDPNQTTSNTIVLLFGAQDVNGDNFAIGLADPIDLSDPNLVLDLSLAISFGFQVPPGNINQISQVDVNGQRMTSAAGGQDDSDIYPGFDGSLLTVGGLADTNGTPPDPFGPPLFEASDPDDELYNLIPFVNNGDMAINVFTLNPSDDDNIFFAALFLGSTTAIVGEGILLSPVSDTNPVNTLHTVTATVQDDNGNPIAGRLVTIEVVSGPNAGVMGSGATDANGEFSLTYNGLGGAGIDTIVATTMDSQGLPLTSNEATKEWTSDVLTCDVDQDGDIDRGDVRSILINRNQPASGPDDPMDADGDGQITIRDAKICIRQCTLPRCAIINGNDI
jgi:hypothetical protein